MTRRCDNNSTSVKRLLIVDPDFELQEGLIFKLRQSGFDVLAARTGDEALQTLAKKRISMVLIDPSLGDMNGVRLGELIREQSGTPFLFITSGSTSYYEQAAIAVGAVTILSKRSHTNDLVTQIQLAIRHASDFVSTQRLNKRLIKKLNRSERRENMFADYMRAWGSDKQQVKSVLTKFARSHNISIDELAEIHQHHSSQVSRIREELARQIAEIQPDILDELNRFYFLAGDVDAEDAPPSKQLSLLPRRNLSAI